MRGLGWSIVRGDAAAAVGGALGRAVLGTARWTNRDTSRPRRGSFDSWPTVPLAPSRLGPNGSRVPTGS